jgi:hypothetical protein
MSIIEVEPGSIIISDDSKNVKIDYSKIFYLTDSPLDYALDNRNGGLKESSVTHNNKIYCFNMSWSDSLVLTVSKFQLSINDLLIAFGFYQEDIDKAFSKKV